MARQQKQTDRRLHDTFQRMRIETWTWSRFYRVARKK